MTSAWCGDAAVHPLSGKTSAKATSSIFSVCWLTVGFVLDRLATARADLGHLAVFTCGEGVAAGHTGSDAEAYVLSLAPGSPPFFSASTIAEALVVALSN